MVISLIAVRQKRGGGVVVVGFFFLVAVVVEVVLGEVVLVDIELSVPIVPFDIVESPLMVDWSPVVGGIELESGIAGVIVGPDVVLPGVAELPGVLVPDEPIPPLADPDWAKATAGSNSAPASRTCLIMIFS